jgi:hypothetical protein
MAKRTKKQTPEGKVKHGFTDLAGNKIDGVDQVLERLSGVINNFWYNMPPGGLMGRDGIPDYDVAINGVKVTIEVKAVGGKLSNFQKREAAYMNRTGVINIVVTGVKAMEDLENLLGDIATCKTLASLKSFRYYTIELA